MHFALVVADWEHPSALTVAVDSLPYSTLVDDTHFGEKRDEDECFKTMGSDLNTQHSEESIMECESSCFLPHLDGETRPPEASIDYNAEEIDAQVKSNCEFHTHLLV